jgi:hypothetical protein
MGVGALNGASLYWDCGDEVSRDGAVILKSVAPKKEMSDMHVKGVAFVSRRMEILKLFGEEKWEQFVETLKEKNPYFEAIYPTSRIPLDYFLFFQDEILRIFFADDQQWYWELGKRSALWAFTQGPFKSTKEDKNLERFLSYGPKSIWSSYYNFGTIKSWLDDRHVVHAQILVLPLMHPHFELSTMGFFQGALSVLADKEPVPSKQKAPEEGSSVYYIFEF